MTNQRIDACITATGTTCIEATAGSGKTTLMVDRMCYLLLEAGVDPEQILAITFTDKAANEMRHRLMIKLQIPLGTMARDVVARMQVSTIHSFCSKVLRMHGLHINRVVGHVVDAVGLTMACDRVLAMIWSRHKDAPPDWLLVLLERYSWAQCGEIFKAALGKRETVDHWLSSGWYDLPDDTVVPDELPKIMTALTSFLTDCFDGLDEDKQRGQWMDHDDSLRYTYQLLTNVDDVRYQLQSQIHHIFVDEFQDTSPVQWAIIMAICDDNNWVSANKCWLVGDRCQAIYGFRGADDQLMRMVVSNPAITQIANARNFRTHPDLVHAMNGVFRRLFDTVNQPFLSMIPKKEASGSTSFRCMVLPSIKEECDCIVQNIRQFRSAYRYSDMAILVRKRSDISVLEQALRADNIPSFVYKARGLCEQACVQVVMNILIGLLDIDDHRAWYGIWRDVYQVSDDDLYTLSQQLDGASIGRYYRNHACKDRNAQWLTDWFDAIRGGPTLQALQGIVYGLDIGFSDADWSSIDTFFDMVRHQWESGAHVLHWLTHCRQHPSAIQVDATPSEDAVQMMTIHAAKGLEFEVVFAPFLHATLYAGGSEPLVISREYGLGISGIEHNPVRSAIRDEVKMQSYAEELRLFYVSLTRSRAHILLSGTTLKRKNASILGALLPMLTQADGHEYLIPGAVTNTLQPTVDQNTSDTLVDVFPISISSNGWHIWSVSQVLDWQRCNKLWALNKARSADLLSTIHQQKGECYHRVLAGALMDQSTNDLIAMSDGLLAANQVMDVLDRLNQQHWFNHMKQNGQVFVEWPFEWRGNGHMLRGRYDCFWLDALNGQFAVLEFKSRIHTQYERYQQQLQMYVAVAQSHYPDLTVSALTGLVDIQTLRHEPIHSDHRIMDIMTQLDTASCAPNPSACNGCLYNEKLVNCSDQPLTKD